MNLKKIIEQPGSISELSIVELEILLSQLELLQENELHNSIKILATNRLRMRKTEGYANREYNGSAMQGMVHDCANSIEKVRASLYRNRENLSREQFEATQKEIEYLITCFSKIANAMRNGSAPLK